MSSEPEGTVAILWLGRNPNNSPIGSGKSSDCGARRPGSATDMLCDVGKLLNLSETEVGTGQDATHESS